MQTFARHSSFDQSHPDADRTAHFQVDEDRREQDRPDHVTRDFLDKQRQANDWDCLYVGKPESTAKLTFYLPSATE